MFKTKINGLPLLCSLEAVAIGLPRSGQITGTKMHIVLLGVADHVELNSVPRTGVKCARVVRQIEAHLDEATIVLKVHYAPHSHGWTAGYNLADQNSVRYAAHHTIGEQFPARPD